MQFLAEAAHCARLAARQVGSAAAMGLAMTKLKCLTISYTTCFASGKRHAMNSDAKFKQLVAILSIAQLLSGCSDADQGKQVAEVAPASQRPARGTVLKKTTKPAQPPPPPSPPPTRPDQPPP